MSKSGPNTFSKRERAGSPRGCLHRFADWLSDWHVTQIFAPLNSFAILIAVVAFVYDVLDRTDERIGRSWQLVNGPTTGDSSKREALEYLNSEDLLLRIKRRVPLVGIDLSNRYFPSNGAYLREVDLRNATLIMAKFKGANLSGALFDGADLSRASFYLANLSDADFGSADLTGAGFQSANLSGADLSNVRPGTLSQSQLNGAWVWLETESVRETKLPGGLSIEIRCTGDAEERKAYYQNFGRGELPPNCQ